MFGWKQLATPKPPSTPLSSQSKNRDKQKATIPPATCTLCSRPLSSPPPVALDPFADSDFSDFFALSHSHSAMSAALPGQAQLPPVTTVAPADETQPLATPPISTSELLALLQNMSRSAQQAALASQVPPRKPLMLSSPHTSLQLAYLSCLPRAMQALTLCDFLGTGAGAVAGPELGLKGVHVVFPFKLAWKSYRAARGEASVGSGSAGDNLSLSLPVNESLSKSASESESRSVWGRILSLRGGSLCRLSSTTVTVTLAFSSPQPQVPRPLSLGALKPNLVVRPPIVIPHIPPAHRKPHAEHYRIYRPRPNNSCKKRRTDASPYDTSISPHDFPADEYSSVSPVDGAPYRLPYGLATAYYSSSSHYADAVPALNGPAVRSGPVAGQGLLNPDGPHHSFPITSNPFLPAGGPPSDSSGSSNDSGSGGNSGCGGCHGGVPNIPFHTPTQPRPSVLIDDLPKDKKIALNTNNIKIKWSDLPEYDGTQSKALDYIMDIMSLLEVSDTMSASLGVALPR
ncbi:hypothetical protein BU17DRAFT_88457 [Hysterangium stoloniferum]|nr:hypothetical protein BU17DRAFT_88457 [Hysterangium stoloniferum]